MRSMKKLILNYHFWMIGIAGMMISSCSTKFKITEENGSKKLYNIKYGDHQQQRMDVFLPANTSPETRVVMIVHGGGWKFGHK